MDLIKTSDLEIKSLDKMGLVRLLHCLLISESASHSIPLSAIACSFDIDTGDGGEDASVKWDGQPSQTNYFDSDTIFQVKATQMGPKECAKELRDSMGNIKPLLRDLFERNGTYILFCNRDGKHAKRVEAMRDALKFGGVQNYATAKLLSYGPTKISEWTNKYFSAIALTKELCKHQTPLALNSWRRWSRYTDQRNTNFVTNEDLKVLVDELRIVARTRRGVLRMCGLPGLGKTRATIEAFSSDEFKDTVAFVNGGGGDAAQTLHYIRSILNSGVSGTLVVDNCSAIIHSELAKLALHADSHLSLITLDSDPDEVSSDQKYVEVQPVEDSVIEKIVLQKYSNMPAADLERIVKFAEGFPRMAVLLTEAELRGEGSLSTLTSKAFVNKLLFPNGVPDQKSLEVISACALFDRFAFNDGQADETTLIAKVLCSNMSAIEFAKIAMQFKKRKILESNMGSWTRVTPRPLAWRLASDWWESCPNNLADLLMDQTWPDTLAEAMCNQLTFLKDIPAAHKVAEKLCSPRCPFASAESLNTRRGSRLFCLIVDVNPASALACLERAFLRARREDLIEAKDGRRHLVWALEKLCWDEKLFERATMILYRLADAENELRISNNATGQLKKLFHVYLSGTQANLKQRVELLNEIAAEFGATELLVDCLCSALRSSSFGRSSSSNDRLSGRNPERDYYPSHSEIITYWKACITLLLRFLAEPSLTSKILHQLASMFSTLIKLRMEEQISQIIEAQQQSSSRFWVEGYQRLAATLRDADAQKIPGEVISVLRGLLETLEPSDFTDRYKLIVGEADWNYERLENGELHDINQDKAREFGEECGRSWPQWREHLGTVLSGKQVEGLGFAEGLAKTLQNRSEFLTNCLDELCSLKENRNPTVLGNFIALIKIDAPSAVLRFLSEIERRKEVSDFAAWLICRAGIDDDNLRRYVRLLKNNYLKIEDLGCLKFGGVLFEVSEHDMTRFLNQILILQPEQRAHEMVLELARTYSYQSSSRWEAMRSIVRKILLRKGFFVSLGSAKNSMLIFDWEFAVTSLLSREDPELTAHAAAEIVSICEEGADDVFYELDRTAVNVLTILMRTYFKKTWDIIGSTLASDEWPISWNLRMLLTNELEMGDGPQPILEAPPRELADWCKNHTQAALLLIGKIRLWENGHDNTMHLNELGEELIKALGKDDGFLNSLGASLQSISVTGIETLRPQYEARKTLMDKLSQHQYLSVRRWAEQQRDYYANKVEQAQKREQEERHGIYDGFIREGW